MNAASPWVSTVQRLFENPDLPSLYERSFKNLNFNCYVAVDSCWIVTELQGQERLAFRVAYSSNEVIEGGKITKKNVSLTWKISSLIGEYQVEAHLANEQQLALHFTTTLKTSGDMMVPFWPRDIVPLAGKRKVPEAEIHVSQVGSRSGQLFFSIPDVASVLYFQNLPDLCHYCHATETSSANVVGGSWPEVGFALPVPKEKPLPASRSFVLSDAYIAFSTDISRDEFALVRQYVDLIANIYLALLLPETQYNHWPEIAEKALVSIAESKGCWFQVQGKPYLNAYVCDYKTPPEIMVQLAVLLPMLDYSK